jgi:6-phosphogluconolactonase
VRHLEEIRRALVSNSDSMGHYDVIRFASAEELALAAATDWLDEVEAAQRAGTPFSVALSGGRITQVFFASTVSEAARRGTSFSGVHFFWADERCVPPESSDSNYRMARELLFGPLRIGDAQVHRIRGELPPHEAASEAEREIRQFTRADASGQPILDLIFLGLGEDGHVASLFPGEPEEIASCPAICRAVFNSPKPPPQRVTLGYGVIASARKVWMLASGTGKAAALEESFRPGGRTPFGRVLATRSHTRVFTDIGKT